MLSSLAVKFISHFGEMGSRWGFNRTVGQIYALLYLSRTPLNADEIAAQLRFSRSNVSLGLKELQSWRLVKMSHQAGDRKEYFTSLEDVWDIFKTIANERHRREIEPTGSVLRDLLLDKSACENDRYAQQRTKEMYNLVEQTNILFSQLSSLSPETLRKLVSASQKLQRIIDKKDKIIGKKDKD